MSGRSYKGPQDPRRIDGSEVYDNLTPATIALEQTYPGMRERNKRALKGEYLEVYFYQQIQSARRCSCWGSNTNPSGVCLICYGTGRVGGYQKYGTEQWILDATLPGVTMNNVEVLVTKQEGPDVFGLVKGAKHGELIARGDFQAWGRQGAQGCPPGRGPVDLIDLKAWGQEDGSLGVFVKTPAQATWQSLTETVLNGLFTTPQRFDVKVTFDRPSVSAESPLFEHLGIRVFRTGPADTIIRCNRPLATQAVSLSELGVLDEWATERWWFDATLPRITDLDWFYEVERGERWKVIDTQKFAPQNYLLSWDASVRRVQTFERMAKYPV